MIGKTLALAHELRIFREFLLPPRLLFSLLSRTFCLINVIAAVIGFDVSIFLFLFFFALFSLSHLWRSISIWWCVHTLALHNTEANGMNESCVYQNYLPINWVNRLRCDVWWWWDSSRMTDEPCSLTRIHWYRILRIYLIVSIWLLLRLLLLLFSLIEK